MINDLMIKRDYDRDVNLLRLQILEFLVSETQNLTLNDLVKITKDEDKDNTVFYQYQTGLLSLTHDIIACLECCWKQYRYNTPVLIVSNWRHGKGFAAVLVNSHKEYQS